MSLAATLLAAPVEDLGVATATLSLDFLTPAKGRGGGTELERDVSGLAAGDWPWQGGGTSDWTKGITIASATSKLCVVPSGVPLFLVTSDSNQKRDHSGLPVYRVSSACRVKNVDDE